MDNSIIQKIQKLLARGDESRNDNDHEREIAMRQANALLVKHGLSMTDVTSQTERAETFGKLGRQSVNLSTRNVWESGVFHEIAKLNGCQVVRISARRGTPQSVWIIGRQLNCATARYLSEYVVSSIKREAKKQGHSITSFGVGAWTGVGEQVEKILIAQRKGNLNGEQFDQSTALMVVNQHKQSMVDSRKALKEFFPRCSTSSYSYGGSQDGVSAGRQYGRNVGLNKQVGGRGQKSIGHE